MDDQEQPASQSDQRRDQIFQIKLQIEQLRRGGNIELAKRTEDKLRIALETQQIADARRSKRRTK